MKDAKIQMVEILSSQRSEVLQHLKEKQSELVITSQPITSEEIEQFSLPDEITAVAHEHVLGLHGIGVITQKDNPVREIALAQLAQVFTGKITNWSQLGGPDAPIRLYARDRNSAIFHLFTTLVLDQKPMVDHATYIESRQALTENVSQDPNGIGFVEGTTAQNCQVLMLSSDDTSQTIFPDEFTIATEDYPLSYRLYAYTLPSVDAPMAQAFVEFALSARGQGIVHKAGFVALTVKAFHSPIFPQQEPQDPSVIDDYVKTLEKAKRISLTFRFQQGDTLDNKALRDLDRLAEYVNARKNSSPQLILVGFSDNIGDYDYNKQLALERTQKVAQELSMRGISVQKVLSVSEELPVGSNKSNQGRAKNRRVEVWIE